MGDVVARMVRIETPQEPQPLLGEQQRKPGRPRRERHHRQRVRVEPLGPCPRTKQHALVFGKRRVLLGEP